MEQQKFYTATHTHTLFSDMSDENVNLPDTKLQLTLFTDILLLVSLLVVQLSVPLTHDSSLSSHQPAR